MNNAKSLDQFFTTKEMADQCLDSMLPFLERMGYDMDFLSFLEPSAGGGSFMDAVSDKGYQIFGSDIDPQRDDVLYADFLKTDVRTVFSLPPKDDLIVIGNPPFGKRSALALEFIQKSFDYSDTVAFILPIQFMKFLTMKNIDKEAKLIINDIIDPHSFTFEGKPYSVRCVFQVWTKKMISHKQIHDYRTYVAPPTKHEDFEMFIYNCVPSALWMFDHDWNFAVYRQGWGDFIPLEKKDNIQLDTKKQWMFFKSDDSTVLNNLQKINFNKLGEKNTSVKGFGKADVIEEYNRLYGKANIDNQENTLF